MADMILTNGYAGLVDLNINQKQRCLNAGSTPSMLHDYSYLLMYGSPKAGQTLEEVRDILLEQIEKLANGDFPEWLLEASKLAKTKVFTFFPTSFENGNFSFSIS